MQVVLLQNVMEGGKPKMNWRPGRTPVVFVAGAVIDCSEATAQKFIEQGIAAPFVAPEVEVEGEVANASYP